MAAEEVKGMERMLGGRKRQKREVKETRVDRWLSLPPRTRDSSTCSVDPSVHQCVHYASLKIAVFGTSQPLRCYVSYREAVTTSGPPWFLLLPFSVSSYLPAFFVVNRKGKIRSR